MPDALTDSPESIATFGELLKYLRRRAGLTQRDLGIAVGYSESQIARLEGGQRLPDLLVLKTEFARALGIESTSPAAMRLLSLAAAARGETPQPSSARPAATPSPKLPPASASRTNLPVSLTRFIGREKELAEVRRMAHENRLVTLIGAGGMGKTRLALEVAATLVGVLHRPQDRHHSETQDGASPIDPDFVDGVWLVELAPIADGSLVAQAIATILDVPEQPGRQHVDALKTFLAEKQMLIILNNCERLIEVCASLAEALLQACPGLHILATSREAFRVLGETTWRVPPLNVPDPAAAIPLEQYADFDAVQLFIELAQLAQPGFVASPDNLATIARICQRLDGMPLAIEMAAVQVADQALEEIALGLDDRFALLVSGSRTAPPHHQTLRATFDWSYQLLGEPERLLLARLSVFSGGWTVEAARAICAQDTDHLPPTDCPLPPAADLLPLLLQLARKSLVATVQHAGQTRYRLLETVRQYAAAKLMEYGLPEAQAMRDRHLAYFLHMAEETMDLGGRHVDAWVQRIEPEFDNLRAAYIWARTLDDPGNLLLRLAAALRPFWYKRGYIEEGMAWLDEALSRDANDIPSAARARALLAKATLCAFEGDVARALAIGEASLALFRTSDDNVGMAWCLELFANNLNDTRAQGYAVEALELFRAVGSLDGIGRSLRSLGMSAYRSGAHEHAAMLLEQSMTIAQEIDDIREMASCLDRLFVVKPGRALDLCAQELARVRKTGNTEHVAALLASTGELLLAEGRYEQAQAALAESVTLSQRMSAAPNRSITTLLSLGYAELAQDHVLQAVEWFRQAHQLARDVGALGYGALAQFLLASAALALGDLDLAVVYVRECLQLFDRYDYRTAIVCVFVQMADLARRQGKLVRAARLLGAADAFGYEVRYNNMKLGHVVLRWHHDAQQAIVKPTLAAAQARLGEAGFETTYAVGQHMTFDQAVEYALSV